MARVWIQDLWVREYVTTNEGGNSFRVRPPKDQLAKLDTLEPRFRTARFGKGRRWRVEWFDADKKKHTKTFEKKKGATEFKKELDQGTKADDNPDHGKKLFSVAAEHWYSTRRKAGESTKLQYRGDLDRYVLPQWGNVQLDKINLNDIEDWVAALEAGTAPAKMERKQSPLAPTVVARLVRIVFGGVLRMAVSRHWIAYNPMAGLEIAPAAARKVEAWLSVPEVEALAEAAGKIDGERSRILVRTLAYSGIRIGEALALRVEDLDVERARLRMHRTWTVTAAGRVEREGTKGSRPGNLKRRSVPIPPTLLADLLPLTKDDAGNDLDPDSYIFRASGGVAIDDHNWRSRVWGDAVKGAGLDDVEGLVIHSLRHTFASLTITGGIDVVTLSKVMGHSKPSITLDIYSHMFDDQADKVADVIGQAISGTPNSDTNGDTKEKQVEG